MNNTEHHNQSDELNFFMSLFEIASFSASIVRSADKVLPSPCPTIFLEYALIIVARYTNDVNILM